MALGHELNIGKTDGNGSSYLLDKMKEDDLRDRELARRLEAQTARYVHRLKVGCSVAALTGVGACGVITAVGIATKLVGIW